MSYYQFAFNAPVERLAIGNTNKVIYYHVIILPASCATALPLDTYPKLRIIGEIADYPIRGAWNPIADGRKYFILSSKFLKMAELSLGDQVDVKFNIDDQDYVELPAELQTQLEIDAKFFAIWDRLSAGKKRFYAYQISSAKQQSTRDRRLQAVLAELKG